MIDCDATNSTTADGWEDDDAVMSWTVVESLVDWDIFDDERRTYLTFMEGCAFRLAGFHIHPWIMEPVRLLAPVARRPRVTERAGREARWTSGFK